MVEKDIFNPKTLCLGHASYRGIADIFIPPFQISRNKRMWKCSKLRQICQFGDEGFTPDGAYSTSFINFPFLAKVF